MRKGAGARRGGSWWSLLGIAALTLSPALAGAEPAGGLAEATKLVAEAERLFAAGDHEAPVPLLERALVIREKALGPEHEDVAEVVLDLGAMTSMAGDAARAERLLLRAVAILEKVRGVDPTHLGAALSEVLYFYERHGDLARAQTYADRALAVLEKGKGAESEEVARALTDVGRVQKERGDYAAAERSYARALAIREKVFGKDAAGSVESIADLAALYEEDGDYAKAAPLFERFVAIQQKAEGPESNAAAVALANAANFYRYAGDFARSDAAYHQAIAILDRTAPDTLGVAASLAGLGLLLEERGEYTQAEPILQRALAITEKITGGRGTEDLATAQNNLGQLYYHQGNYARAEALYQSALAISEATLRPGHPQTTKIFQNLGALAFAQEQYPRARALYEKAVHLYEVELGPEHPELGRTLSNLGDCLQRMGELDAAERVLQRALALREKALGAEHPDVANSLHNLASLYQAKGDFARAEPLFERALAIRTKVLGPRSPDVALTTAKLAAVHEALGDDARATSELARANDVRERHVVLMLSSGSEAQKRALLARTSNETEASIALAVRTGRADAARMALTALLRRKGRALDAMAASLVAVRREVGPAGQALLDELSSIRSQVSTRTLAGPGRAGIAAHGRDLAQLTAREEELEAAISAKSAAFRAAEQPITADAVQAAMPAGCALVEWAVYRPFRAGAKGAARWGEARVAAVALAKTGEPAWVDLGDMKAIEHDVTAFRRALATPVGDPKPAARALDARVFAPVRARLGDARWALLSPDGALDLVPFAALVDEDGRYLVERWGLSYVTSGRDLLRFSLREAPRAGPAVIGDPAFGPREAGDVVATRGERSVDMTRLRFSPLPGTEGEARSIGARLPGASMLTGAAATEEALKALHGPRVLHVATHGFFLPSPAAATAAPTREAGTGAPGLGAMPENPLLRSGIALAGANVRRSAGDDGILTALEASALDLDGTALVTLSACETGVGEATSGEGVYGLRRALVLAGSATQVMSLWKVDDAATRDLMTAYYDGLATGAGRAEGLRRVQVAMLDTSGRSHPYYWAAFLVSGDPSALDGSPRPPGKVTPGARGCACDASGARGSWSGAWLAAIGLAIGGLRRRLPNGSSRRRGCPATRPSAPAGR